jgi:putative transposase
LTVAGSDLRSNRDKEDPTMRKSRFTKEQIIQALTQAVAGTPVAEICRKLEITETKFYRWKKKYGGLGVSELRKLRQLREENRKLKQLVADLSSDKHILRESLTISTFSSQREDQMKRKFFIKSPVLTIP